MSKWYLADGEKAIDEFGFDSIDELLDHYKFYSDLQQIELVLIDADNEVVDHGYYNTKTIL
jgi:hypothetical protein